MGAVSPAGAQQAQDHAGDDAGQRLRQHDVADALPARAAQAGAHRAELGRHRAQRLFGGADDHRQRHDRQGQRAGQDRGAEAQEEHEQPQAEQAVDHRGDARQVDDRQADRAGQPGVAGVLGQVDRAAHADGDRDQRGAQGQQQRAHDGREDAAGLHARRAASR